MKTYSTLFVIMLVHSLVDAQNINNCDCGQQYQITYDRRYLSVCDTIRGFEVNGYNGWFVSRILLLKTGKISSFEIARLELRNDSISYSYRAQVNPYHSRRKEEYPDTIRMVYSKIEDLIKKRLYVNIKDPSRIDVDTISVIWGRSIGNGIVLDAHNGIPK